MQTAALTNEVTHKIAHKNVQFYVKIDVIRLFELVWTCNSNKKSERGKTR